MPRIILEAFCNVFLPVNAIEQKYQNLYQLFFRPSFVYMAFMVYLSEYTNTAQSRYLLAIYQTIL